MRALAICFRKSLAFSINKTYGGLTRRLFCATAEQPKEDIILTVPSDKNSTNKYDVNSYTYRTCSCGHLRPTNVGQTVTLCGWISHQRMGVFAVIYDAYGETQLLIDKNDKVKRMMENVPLQSVVKITGTVEARPFNQVNNKQLTGSIEVVVDDMTVLNEAQPRLPFNVREYQKAREQLRLKYRFLDMRFHSTQYILRYRSELLMQMREFLIKEAAFTEVETPTLSKQGEGGAHEFIVPSRFPGLFYALTQSPQIYKQILMAGQMDRYFQMAKCYRNEKPYSDRQPEFTQLDMELSFTTVEGVMKLVEHLLRHCWPSELPPLPTVFPIMTAEHAINNYGSYKPDTRYGYKIIDCTQIAEPHMIHKDTPDIGVFYIKFPKRHGILTSQEKRLFHHLKSQHLTVQSLVIRPADRRSFVKYARKYFGQEGAEILADEIGIEQHNVILMAFGERIEALKVMGIYREEHFNSLETTQKLETRENRTDILWIVDFKLFEKNTKGNLEATHHPFTAPHPDDVHLLDTDPLKVRSLAYDLVLNGSEIAGGSIRIHDSQLQKKIFDLLKMDSTSLEYFLDMLECGCPPHGGVALGLDRLISKLFNTSSIRDVIAFPKSCEGKELMNGAPTELLDIYKDTFKKIEENTEATLK